MHPWQWVEKLAIVFAADLAARDLVCLGHGPDTYRAQQSIRTFWNASVPDRRYVKTALSVLNMGFLRGLSADYMRNTPAINDWIHALLESDPYFAEQGFGILREVAGIGYRSGIFEAALPKASPYRKMLAALWRESPVPRLRPGQRLMTMAALLHRDRDGAALLPLLVRASGLGVDALARSLPRLLPRADPALPDRLRPRVHAARRERDPRARGSRAGGRVHEGHRRGGGHHGSRARSPRTCGGSA